MERRGGLKVTFETQQTPDHFNQNYFQTVTPTEQPFLPWGTRPTQSGYWQFSPSIQEICTGPFAPSATQVSVIGRQLGTRESALECHLGKNPETCSEKRLGVYWVWGRKRLHKKSSERAKIYVKVLTHQKKFFYRLSACLIWFQLLEIMKNAVFPSPFGMVDITPSMYINISL